MANQTNTKTLTARLVYGAAASFWLTMAQQACNDPAAAPEDVSETGGKSTGGSGATDGGRHSGGHSTGGGLTGTGAGNPGSGGSIAPPGSGGGVFAGGAGGMGGMGGEGGAGTAPGDWCDANDFDSCGVSMRCVRNQIETFVYYACEPYGSADVGDGCSFRGVECKRGLACAADSTCQPYCELGTECSGAYECETYYSGGLCQPQK